MNIKSRLEAIENNRAVKKTYSEVLKPYSTEQLKYAIDNPESPIAKEIFDLMDTCQTE